MSGRASSSVVVHGSDSAHSGGYNNASFTPMQWQELNHQAMIYKYLVAGLQVPPDLVVPIRRSFDALSSRFFAHPSLGYCSYYGKKFDPEPGRCRRTDGKKWRCSKDAHPDSKYCERHMHRGRNRSRKPVETQPSSSSSQSLSAATMPPTRISSNSNGANSGGSFRNIPMFSALGSDYGFSLEASGSLGSLLPSQDGLTTSAEKQRSDQQRFLNLSSAHGIEPIVAEQRAQQQLVHPFFSEWPMADGDDDDDGSNKNLFSSTRLSISTVPRASELFSSRSGGYSANGDFDE